LCGIIQREPGIMVERIFWDGSGGKPRSMESGSQASVFDLLAFTTSFEEQWVLIPWFLEKAGIPARSHDRDQSHPLVAIGGFAVRLNPGPVAPFADLVVPSEAEACFPEMLRCLRQGRGLSRKELLDQFGSIPGLAVRPEPGQIIPALLHSGADPVAQVQPEPDSVFGDMYLVETGRGCPVGCRFCAVGHSRRPPLFFSTDRILAAAQDGIRAGMRVGLVGASLGRHPDLAQLVQDLAEAGADLSPASLDATVLASPAGATLLSRLAVSRQRTVTLAVESGSERLRRVINKPLSTEELECAVKRLGESGILHLKVYLMYGLPTEQPEDLEQTVDLVKHMREWLLASQRGRGRAGKLTLSANPFVPKPHTPLAEQAMPTVRKLKAMRASLAGKIRKIGGVSFSGFSPRLAALQCLLDRATPDLADLLEATKGAWPPPRELMVRLVPNMLEVVENVWQVSERGIGVDVGCDPAKVAKERQRAMEAKITPPCSPERCPGCGVCEGLT
jgi:radical SAM superfamily enzyme YgiQ (UPF0313 family)